MLIAAIQMTSGEDKSANLATAERLVRRSAKLGARFIGLPENFPYMGSTTRRLAEAEALDGPVQTRMKGLAKELNVYLLAGSFLEAGAPGGRTYNTSVLYGPSGEVLGVYRKMHLFDVEVGTKESYRESDGVAPGEDVVVAKTDFGLVGMSICYDLRFPELYRRHSDAGAVLLTVPSAFTLTTGKDHWEVLLRARAIENQAYVVAPAQQGRHPQNRDTYGHAMIVDPWGVVVACVSDGEGVALAAADGQLVEKLRARMPTLKHRRLRA